MFERCNVRTCKDSAWVDLFRKKKKKKSPAFVLLTHTHVQTPGETSFYTNTAIWNHLTWKAERWESRLSDLLKGTAAIQHLDGNYEHPVSPQSTDTKHQEERDLHTANVSARVCVCSYHLKVNEKKVKFEFYKRKQGNKASKHFNISSSLQFSDTERINDSCQLFHSQRSMWDISFQTISK